MAAAWDNIFQDDDEEQRPEEEEKEVCICYFNDFLHDSVMTSVFC